MRDLQKHIIQEFGSKNTQQLYFKEADKGLWLSEKYFIKKYFNKNSTILDLGCGTGRTTIPLFKMHYKIVGIDITPEMIINAKKIAKNKKLDIKYEVGDATRLNFNDNTFDNAIFSNNGLTQIPGRENRLKALGEIYRILKPGGYFIFTVHKKKLSGFTLFWITQWIKHYILRNFGLKFDEQEFGDRFFNRDINSATIKTKQYIHIPSVKSLKKDIKISGFNLIDYRSGMIKGEKIYRPMFYICQK